MASMVSWMSSSHSRWKLSQAGTGFGKSLGILLGVGDHQVDVIESVRQGLVQALEHRDAKS